MIERFGISLQKIIPYIIANTIIEYLKGTTTLTSPILIHITLKSIPIIKKNAVADKPQMISVDGAIQSWKGKNNNPVRVTEIAVIKDTQVDGIDGSNFLVDISLITIKKTANNANKE